MLVQIWRQQRQCVNKIKTECGKPEKKDDVIIPGSWELNGSQRSFIESMCKKKGQ